MIQLYRRGNKYTNENNDTITVMASEDKYIMARRKGCIPFVMTEKEFTELLLLRCFINHANL